jgi:hypothetical protein
MNHFMAKTCQYLIYGHHYFFVYYHLAQFITALVVVRMLSSVETLFLIFGPQYIAPYLIGRWLFFS